MVSIVVPIYNGDRYLATCVNSLRNQTLQEIEIILADDGSTDNTAVLCDQYAAEDPRVKVLHLTHQGLSQTRNRGMDHACGAFIAFVDADDWTDETMYSQLLEKIILEQADMVMCSHVNYDGVRDRKVAYPWLDDTVFDAQDIREVLLPAIISPINLNGGLQPRVWGTVWKCLFNRQFLVRNQIVFPTSFSHAQDVMFLLDVLLQTRKAVFISAPYYHYRNNVREAPGMTQRYNPNIYKDQRRVQQRMLEIAAELHSAERMSAPMHWRKINTVIWGVLNLCLPDSPLSLPDRTAKAKEYMRENDYNLSFDRIGTAYHPAKEKIVLAALRCGLVSWYIAYKSLRNRLL